MDKNMGETTHQIGAKRPTGESTQGVMTHGWNDFRAKLPVTPTTYVL